MKKTLLICSTTLLLFSLTACGNDKKSEKTSSVKTEKKQVHKSKEKKTTNKNDNSKISTSNNNKANTDNVNQTSNKNNTKSQNNQIDHNLTDDDATKANRYNYDPLAYMYYGTPAQQAERQRIAQHNQEVYDKAEAKNANSAKFYDETDGTYHAPGSNPDGTPDAWVQDQIDWNNSHPDQNSTNDDSSDEN